MDTGWRGQIAVLLGIPLSFFNPLVFRQDAMQLLGSLVASRDTVVRFPIQKRTKR